MQNLASLLTVLGYIVIIVLGAVVSEMSYNDEVAEEIDYCNMVRGGRWHDYKEVGCDE